MPYKCLSFRYNLVSLYCAGILQKERDEVEILIHLEGAAAALACKWKLSFLSTEDRTVHQTTLSASTRLYQLTLLLHLKQFFSSSYSGINCDAHVGEQMSVNAMSVKFRDICEPQWCVYSILVNRTGFLHSLYLYNVSGAMQLVTMMQKPRHNLFCWLRIFHGQNYFLTAPLINK